MAGIGKLALRATLGGYFVGHGLQKLTGSFGGHGPDGTGQFFESVGLRPGREHALLAGAAEAGGGSLLALGLFTPLGVSALTGVPAVILAALAALADSGPGPYSVDEAAGIRLRGPVVTAVAMGAGAAGAIYVSNHGAELFGERVSDEPLRRSVEQVGAES